VWCIVARGIYGTRRKCKLCGIWAQVWSDFGNGWWGQKGQLLGCRTEELFVGKLVYVLIICNTFRYLPILLIMLILLVIIVNYLLIVCIVLTRKKFYGWIFNSWLANVRKSTKRATKLIPEFKNMVCIDHLELLKLPSLHYRQVRGDMIEMYKILFGKYDTAVTPWVMREHSYITRGMILDWRKVNQNMSYANAFLLTG